MKNLGKILALVAVVGGVALIATSGGKGDVVAEGVYDNKGQTAKWEIREKDDVLTAYIQFPGNPMTEIASHGSIQSLGQVIDARMRENGYLPIPEPGSSDGTPARMGSHSNAQQAGLSG